MKASPPFWPRNITTQHGNCITLSSPRKKARIIPSAGTVFWDVDGCLLADFPPRKGTVNAVCYVFKSFRNCDMQFLTSANHLSTRQKYAPTLHHLILGERRAGKCSPILPAARTATCSGQLRGQHYEIIKTTRQSRKPRVHGCKMLKRTSTTAGYSCEKCPDRSGHFGEQCQDIRYLKAVSGSVYAPLLMTFGTAYCPHSIMQEWQ